MEDGFKGRVTTRALKMDLHGGDFKRLVQSEA